MRNGATIAGDRSVSVKSYHDAYRGEHEAFRDDMTDSMSFQGGHKGHDFADVAGPYFHEIDPSATARKRQASSMPVITIAQAEMKKDSSSPAGIHDQRSR